MRLATLDDGTADGRLVVVSKDGQRAASCANAPTMQVAVENWERLAPDLLKIAETLNDGDAEKGFGLDTANVVAPLPRAWQWLDGSAYPNHGALMQKAYDLPPIATDRPLMYQGMSDTFFGWNADVVFPSEDDGIDFEGEFAVVVDRVPGGTSPKDALAHVRLILQINDWSLRAIAPIEMRTGFGWIQAKPACSVAPFAVTPDELGSAWRDGRIGLNLRTEINGEVFGDVPAGDDMAFDYGDLIAHACRTRTLVAGTIIGGGTVSSSRFREVGSSCIAERRAIETIDAVAPSAFLKSGDRVTMTGYGPDTGPVFGTIDQTVIVR